MPKRVDTFMEDPGFDKLPHSNLGLICTPGCEDLAAKIDHYLVEWRKEREKEHSDNPAFKGYHKDTYILKTSFSRFGTGEGKCTIGESVRGYDIYIVCDCFNHGVKFKMYDYDVPMSPDEHFANLKRIISAIGGKANSITVIMPMLYEGRQHKRSTRESLDGADMLRELCEGMHVDNIITFDAHDARVQNAIPLFGFENVQPVYQMLKCLTREYPDLKIDKDHLMIISPDEGGMHRCIYYSNVLGVDLGMFYKRRDYSRVVQGRNPIIAHEFLGSNVEGKDVIIVDDMISSGDSMIDVSKKLKELKANRIFICTAFGLFCNGLDTFDKAYTGGLFDRVFTTNLVYRTPELLQRKWYTEVDLSKYCAFLIDHLNHDISISKLLDPVEKIDNLLVDRGFKTPEEIAAKHAKS